MTLPIAVSIFAMATVTPSTNGIHDTSLVQIKDSAFPFDGLLGENVDAHDPSVVEFNGTYICFTTSGHEFCAMRTSKDLKSWKLWGQIQEAPDWLKKQVTQHRSVWAPAALKVGKTLRVYYCASERFGDNSSVIGMAENSNFDPTKPLVGWVDKGKMLESKSGTSNFNAIDPDPFVDEDGRHWVTFGSYWSGLYMVEVDPKSGLTKNPSAAPIHIASNSGERGNPLEAPFLCYHKGYYYLFVVYGLAAQGIRSTYRMMVGRSKSMDEPFVGFDGKKMTEGGHTVLLKGSPPMFAPGGGNIFRDKDGSWKLAYHFYDGRRYWHRDMWGRPAMQIRDVLWGDDGWPVPGLPIGASLQSVKGKGIAGDWIHQADFGDVQTINLTSDGKIRAGERTGSWREKDGILTLTWPNNSRSDEIFEDQVRIAYDGRYYVGRNKAGTIIRGIRRDAAGW
jgi:arabinan endo-1,5-alpha-L-arabinosidase